MKRTRRWPIALLAVLALTLAGTAAAEKVRLHTDWKMDVSGNIPPFFLGVDRGYYKAEGLDVKILGGTGSGNAIQVISAGSYELGFADFGSLIIGRLRGARIKAVMGLLQQGGGSFIYLKKSGIKSPADLKGRAIAMPPGGSEDASVRAFVAKNGLNMRDIKWQYMTAWGRSSPSSAAWRTPPARSGTRWSPSWRPRA
jgi:NitT/TauT family transport system substrate-binding protein